MSTVVGVDVGGRRLRRSACTAKRMRGVPLRSEPSLAESNGRGLDE